MARKGRSNGKLARGIAIGTAVAGLVGGLIIAVGLMQYLSAGIHDAAIEKRGWGMGLGLAALCAVLTGVAGYMLAGKVAARVTDVGLAVGKLGRGGSEVRVRSGGNDEVGALGRAVQYLATDLAQLLKEQEKAGGGMHVSMDPLVKQLRDKTVPQGFADVAGFELDGQLAGGSRGGLDYFDLVSTTGDNPQSVVYVVSAEGHGALAVHACKLARDELHRALVAGATPRKALAHTNKVCKTSLPTGV